jgi:hypothetical protein
MRSLRKVHGMLAVTDAGCVALKIALTKTAAPENLEYGYFGNETMMVVVILDSIILANIRKFLATCRSPV